MKVFPKSQMRGREELYFLLIDSSPIIFLKTFLVFSSLPPFLHHPIHPEVAETADSPDETKLKALLGCLYCKVPRTSSEYADVNPFLLGFLNTAMWAPSTYYCILVFHCHKIWSLFVTLHLLISHLQLNFLRGTWGILSLSKSIT